MKKINLFIICIIAINTAFAQYNPAIWQVDDSTNHVQSITGLSPSNGYSLDNIMQGYDETYTFSWIGDVCKINFTNSTSPNQWADFTFRTIQWEGESTNYFMTNTSGIPQDHKIAKGYSVDFSSFQNRTITFKVQSTQNVIMLPTLVDISGKISNGAFPKVTAIQTAGGIDVADESKWQTITLAWNGDITADSAVSIIEDWYTPSWWGVINAGLNNVHNPLDSSRIIGLDFILDGGDNGAVGDYKEIYIKDIVIGAAPNPVVFSPSDSFYIPQSEVVFDAQTTMKTIDVTSDMPWTAISNDSWITITPLNETGNGQIIITTEVNTGDMRTAAITISRADGKTITVPVMQVSANPTISVSANAIQINSNQGRTVTVTSNTTWTAVSNQSWLYVYNPSGIGNGTITCKAQKNESDIPREATVTVTIPSGISQTIIFTQSPENTLNPVIWEVQDSTVNVQSITGLVPSNGFNNNGTSIIAGYNDTYSYSWIDDICKVNFTNTNSPSQWSDFTFSLINWEGETGKYFVNDRNGIPQDHNYAKGYSVDFTQPENRTISFKVQTTSDITFWSSLQDIQGKISNGVFPVVNVSATNGGINTSDESKWQTITVSWGDAANVDSAVSIMEDWYTGSWWGVDNIGLKANQNPLDQTRITAFNLMFDAGSIGNVGDYKEVYIKDVVIGAAANPEIFKPQIPFYINTKNIISQAVASTQTIDLVSDNAWTASSDQTWVEITPNTGVGNAQITVQTTANAGDIRYATITVTKADGKVITIPVTQVSANPTLSVSKTEIQLGATVNLSAEAIITSNTTWNISKNQSWLQVNVLSGIGTAAIVCKASQNLSNADRFATLVITYASGSSQLITVTQLAKNTYNTDIWEVEDNTSNIMAITGLVPSNGYNVNNDLIYPGWNNTYAYSWINDICKIDFTKQMDNNWVDFSFSLINWEGNTYNCFINTIDGNPQEHNVVQGYSVDFSEPENRVVSFKIQSSDEIELWPSVKDIKGKISNGEFPIVNTIPTIGGIDIADDSKWQTITVSWGGSATADSSVAILEDWYSGTWWNVDNTGLKDAHTPLDSSRIVLFSMMFDPFTTGTVGKKKIVYIKDLQIGAATPIEFSYVNPIIAIETTAGNLNDIIPVENREPIKELTLTGTIDIRDFIFIRDSLPNLVILNMYGVTIAGYEGDLDTTSTKAFVSFPANTIPKAAFKNMETLQELVLPVTLVTIQENAFSGCTQLQTIEVSNSTPIALENTSNVFSDLDKTICRILVPFGSEDAYANADGWKDFQNIEEVTGIETIPTKQELSIAPNPVTDYFTVEGLEGTATVTILDITGKTIISKTVVGEEQIIVTDLPQGIYVVNVGNAQMKLVKK